MFKKALAFAVTAACLTAGAAHAQSYGNQYDQRAQHYDRNGSYNNGDRHHRGGRDGYDRRDDRYSRESRQDHRYDSRDYRYRNNGYNNSYRAHMRRGERLSHNHGRHHVVNDWRGHRGLYAPHRGHHWVQVDGNYALVAIATGIIAHVLLN